LCGEAGSGMAFQPGRERGPRPPDPPGRGRGAAAPAALLLLAALLGGAGCSQPCFQMADDLRHYQEAALHTALACPEPDSLAPAAACAPRSVTHPEARERFISLAECVALALENGRVGGSNIRVFAFDPAVAGVAIEESLARFDARWQTSMTWS